MKHCNDFKQVAVEDYLAYFTCGGLINSNSGNAGMLSLFITLLWSSWVRVVTDMYSLSRNGDVWVFVLIFDVFILYIQYS